MTRGSHRRRPQSIGHRSPRRPRAARRAARGRREDASSARVRSVDVARLEQQTVAAVADDLGDAADPRRDDRHAGHERFLDYERAVLRPDRGNDEHVDRGERVGARGRAGSRRARGRRRPSSARRAARDSCRRRGTARARRRDRPTRRRAAGGWRLRAAGAAPSTPSGCRGTRGAGDRCACARARGKEPDRIRTGDSAMRPGDAERDEPVANRARRRE